VQEIDALLAQGRVPALLPPKRAQALPKAVLPGVVAIVIAVLAVVVAVYAVGSTLTTSWEDPTADYKFTGK
jgi:hypothetical protein